MSSISPITTLFPAASAAVTVSDANRSQAPSSNPVDFLIVSFPSFEFQKVTLESCRTVSMRLSLIFHPLFVDNFAMVDDLLPVS
jgi:hypothetical protein